MFKDLHIRDYDFKLILLIICVNVIGVMAVGSANSSNQGKFLACSVMGFFLMVVISLFDYTIFLRFYWLWYIINLGLLVAVRIAGHSVNNAQRWFEVFGIRFQPSETAKILLIIFFAQFIMRYRDRINNLKFLFCFAFLAAVPLYLILDQPDLSTTIVLFILISVMLFVGGISWKYILAAFAVAVPAVIAFLSIILKEGQQLIDDYQRKRILSFIYPEKYVDDAYQQTNSVIAIGSGQLWGKGYNNDVISSLKNGNFIIMPDTDFIFAVIGEELGFVGTLTVIVLLFLIVIECFMIGRRAKDAGGRVIACAMGTLIGIQTFFNVGVATFLLPNTGLTLPFISYGMTSLISMYIGMGFVLNVRFRSGQTGREKREVF